MKWKVSNLFPGVQVRYQVEAVLHRGRTHYQRVDILRTSGFGTALFLDGDPQSAELDEHIYHEVLVHPALVSHPHPRSVLIAGGGEGATLREVLRHNSVERVVMVDIDGEVVELCKRLLPSWHQGAFDDPRVELHYADAFAYLANGQERFDVVILDLTASLPRGPSAGLYDRDFYRTAQARLAHDGVLGLQAHSANVNNLVWHTRIIHALSGLFPIVRPYSAYIPFYGEPWGFAVASGVHDPLGCTPAGVDAVLARRGCTQLRFYDGQCHQGLFALPLPIRSRLEEAQRQGGGGG